MEMIKSAWQVMGREILNLFNRCKKERAFPKHWKEGRLVLLAKKDKSPRSDGAYQPICLLSCLGKIWERIILERLPRVMKAAEHHNQ